MSKVILKFEEKVQVPVFTDENGNKFVCLQVETESSDTDAVNVFHVCKIGDNGQIVLCGAILEVYDIDIINISVDSQGGFFFEEEVECQKSP